MTNYDDMIDNFRSLAKAKQSVDLKVNHRVKKRVLLLKELPAYQIRACLHITRVRYFSKMPITDVLENNK